MVEVQTMCNEVAGKPPSHMGRYMETSAQGGHRDSNPYINSIVLCLWSEVNSRILSPLSHDIPRGFIDNIILVILEIRLGFLSHILSSPYG